MDSTFHNHKRIGNWDYTRTRFNRSLQPCRLLQFGFFSWANSQLSCSMVLGDEFGSWPAAADLILCDVAASLASPLVRLSWAPNSGHPKHSPPQSQSETSFNSRRPRHTTIIIQNITGKKNLTLWKSLFHVDKELFLSGHFGYFHVQQCFGHRCKL